MKQDPVLGDSARKWAVRVELKDRSFTFGVFTFPYEVYRHQVLLSGAVLEWIGGRKVDDVYPWTAES